MKSNNNDPDALLSEIQAADFLRLSARTLQAWRTQGIGPRFVKAGRAVRYRRSGLIEWVEARTVEKTAASNLSWGASNDCP